MADSDFKTIMLSMTPLLLGLLGVLLLITPLRLFQGLVPTPLFPIAVIFFWSIYGPQYLPAPATFVIGITQDLLLGGPFGVWASVYLVAQFVAQSQRSYFFGRDQHVVWLGFCISTIAAGVLLWLEMSLISRSWMPVLSLAAQLAMTMLLYPVLAIAFSSVHKRVIVER